MTGSGHDDKPTTILNDKIDELEVLLRNHPTNTRLDDLEDDMDDNIPVLDDMVEFDPGDPGNDLYDDVPEFDSDLIEAKVNDAFNNIDDRITSELETLVSILKNSIKDTVLTEIREQLESEHRALSPQHKPGEPGSGAG